MIPKIEIDSKYAHFMTGTVVTVIDVWARKVKYRDEKDREYEQAQEWFLSSYFEPTACQMNEGYSVTEHETWAKPAKIGVDIASGKDIAITAVDLSSHYVDSGEAKPFAIVPGDYWEDVITHELVKIKDFKAQVVSYLEFDGLTHMHNEGTFRKYYKPKHLLSNLKK